MHQKFTLKEKPYDDQQAQLFLQKDWKNEELNYIKKKLEIREFPSIKTK